MEPDNKPLRILVIDDDERILTAYRKILPGQTSRTHTMRRMSRHSTGDFPLTVTVDIATQGQEGFQKAQQALDSGDPYALAFVDGRMPPGWDGLETIRHLRAMDPELQIVFSSAYNDLSWRQLKKEIGLDEGLLVIRKPFDQIEIQQSTLSLLEKWRLRRQQAQQTESLKALLQEREALLDGTTSGTVDLLVDLLSQARPEIAAMAQRVQTVVRTIVSQMPLSDRWSYEVAAQLSVLGLIILPEDLTRRAGAGLVLSSEEQAQIAQHPRMTQHLLRKIPHLEKAAAIIGGMSPADSQQRRDGLERDPEIILGSRLITLVSHIEQQRHRGVQVDATLHTLRTAPPAAVHAATRRRDLMKAINDFYTAEFAQKVVREHRLGLRELKTGMLVSRDIKTPNGVTIIASQRTLTEAMIARLNRFSEGVGVQEPIYVQTSATNITP